MRRTELVNHIKGSYLKNQFLEAFLVQSAYIEGLLKIFADYVFWRDIMNKIPEETRLINELRGKIRKFSFKELIDFLHKSNLIEDSQKKIMHKYREKRNNVIHDLVLQISEEKFEKELQETCELGDKIIEDHRFQEIEKILDDVEERKRKIT